MRHRQGKRHTGHATAAPARGLVEAGDDVIAVIGSLDEARTDLVPDHELWIKRQDTWLHALPGAEQFDEDRA